MPELPTATTTPTQPEPKPELPPTASTSIRVPANTAPASTAAAPCGPAGARPEALTGVTTALLDAGSAEAGTGEATIALPVVPETDAESSPSTRTPQLSWRAVSHRPAMMRLLALSAGLCSSTLALLALEGQLPSLDGVIFADTGNELPPLYEHLQRLASALEQAGVPLYRVSRGNLATDIIDPTRRSVSIPYFARHPYRPGGRGRRQCAQRYKLAPIRRTMRELLGAPGPRYRRVPPGRTAQLWLGYCLEQHPGQTDQAQRVHYELRRYPLREMGWSRADCARFLAERGWSVPAGGCGICPLHGNQHWRDIRDHHPEQWAQAIDLDRALRAERLDGSPTTGRRVARRRAYLHRSRIPLEHAPLDAPPFPAGAPRRPGGGHSPDRVARLLELGDSHGCMAHQYSGRARDGRVPLTSTHSPNDIAAARCATRRNGTMRDAGGRP